MIFQIMIISKTFGATNCKKCAPNCQKKCSGIKDIILHNIVIMKQISLKISQFLNYFVILKFDSVPQTKDVD